MSEERTRFQKIILALLAGMIVLFAILTAVSRSQEGIEFRGGLLKQTVTAEAMRYAGRARGETVSVTVSAAGKGVAAVDVVVGDRLHDVYSVEYPLPPIQTEDGGKDGVRILKNGEAFFEGAYDPSETFIWYDQDGRPTPMMDISGYSGDDPWNGYEFSAATIMGFTREPELTARGSWALYAVMTALTVLVVIPNAAFPMAVFRLNHCCDVRDPEPSDFYLAMLPVGWVLLTVFSLAGYILALRQIL